jgi:hypothetical protein
VVPEKSLRKILSPKSFPARLPAAYGFDSGFKKIEIRDETIHEIRHGVAEASLGKNAMESPPGK